MSEWGQGLTLTQNVDWGFILSTTLPLSEVVTQLHYIQMSSQGVLSGKRASNDPGLCPIKGQYSDRLRSWARAWNQFSSLSLSTTRTTPHYQVLVFHPAFNLIIGIQPRDPQGRLWSYKLQVEPPLTSLSPISFPRIPTCPGTQYSPTVRCNRDIIQCLLALLYQWRHYFGSLKCFQSRLAIRANTYFSGPSRASIS